MMNSVNLLLHEENFGRIPLAGEWMRHKLAARAAEIATATTALPDPDISIVIRSRNDGAYVRQWFEDIRAQQFGGDVEVIFVDTESTDETPEYARSQGARVITVKQADFTYPRALNLGFEAAKHPWVLTTVGHASLSNRMMFKSLTYWSQNPQVAGVYCWPMSNWNGTFWDHLTVTLSVAPTLRKPVVQQAAKQGSLGANGAFVRRDVWQKLGGFDERFAGGGEDTELARAIAAAGYLLVREPLCSVLHSHSLNFVDTIKQLWHWYQIGKAKPQSFDAEEVHARRPDLRQKFDKPN